MATITELVNRVKDSKRGLQAQAEDIKNAMIKEIAEDAVAFVKQVINETCGTNGFGVLRHKSVTGRVTENGLEVEVNYDSYYKDHVLSGDNAPGLHLSLSNVELLIYESVRGGIASMLPGHEIIGNGINVVMRSTVFAYVINDR